MSEIEVLRQEVNDKFDAVLALLTGGKPENLPGYSYLSRGKNVEAKASTETAVKPDPAVVAEAERMLTENLARGPLTVADVMQIAADSCLPIDAVTRARENLKIVLTRQGSNAWLSLPHRNANGDLVVADGPYVKIVLPDSTKTGAVQASTEKNDGITTGTVVKAKPRKTRTYAKPQLIDSPEIVAVFAQLWPDTQFTAEAIAVAMGERISEKAASEAAKIAVKRGYLRMTTRKTERGPQNIFQALKRKLKVVLTSRTGAK